MKGIPINENRVKNGFKKSLIATAVALACSPQFVLAASDFDKAMAIEEVVVTGSNIRRKADYDNPAPVQTVGAMEISNTGAVQIQDVFKGITSNSGSQLANRQNERQGVSQFSLRGLGVGSTLTLVNGRRAGLFAVPDASGQLFTDVNQYPVNMIERVEVLTDGASATYGSEALAGVVNIMTRDDFEGLEFSVEQRDASNESSQVSGAFGAAFDKGHFTVFANYYTQDGNFRGDFDWIKDNLTFSSSTGSPGSYAIADVTPSTSPSTPDTIGRLGDQVPDADCAEAGGIVSGDRCRYNFIDQRRLIAEEDRFQVFTKFNYDLSDTVNFYSEISHSRNKVTDALGGAVNRNGVAGGDMFIPGSHPFNFWVNNAGTLTYMDPTVGTNGADWASGALVASDLAGQFRPLGTLTGDRDNAEEIVTVFSNSRISTGLDIELDDNWFLALNYTWANSDYTRREPRNWATDRFQEIINGGKWNPFGTAIVNPGFVSPKDGVTTAANSGDVLEQFNRSKTNSGKVEQSVVEAIVSGELTPSLGVAVGVQYRDLTYENYPDGLSGALEGGRDDPTEPVDGGQDAIALFTEAAWSVNENLETQFALRYEDYGDKGGSTLDPKVAFKYDLSEAFSVRGSWGTSFQAPSITQVSGSTGNDTIDDPQFAGASFNVTVIAVGTPDLEPQTSTNYNLGMLYTTDAGLDLSVDYWVYALEDMILTGSSPQAVVDACGAGTCADIVRDGSGQLSTVYTSFENRGTADVEGVDLKVAFAPDLGDTGDWRFDLSATKFLKYESSEFGDIKNSRNSGNPFGSTPDLKINAGVTWMTGNHTVNLSGRFIDEYFDDKKNNPIDSQTTFDVRYSYLFPELVADGDTRFTLGVVNLTDEDPSLIEARPGFDTEVHDPRGRQVYVSLKQTF